MPPHWRSLIPSEYLKAADLAAGDVTVTIAKVEKREIEQLAKPGKEGAAKGGPPQKEKRGVVTFTKSDKIMPLNVVNAASMAAMWGTDYTRWPGHEITLYAGRAQLGADEVDAIRVRGAPDLSAPIEFEITMPRRRSVKVRLIPTGKGQSAQAAAAREMSDEEKATITAAEREPGGEG